MEVINNNGKKIDFNSAVNVMDDEIREALHNSAAVESEQDFFLTYASEHEKVFCETWELNKENPVW